MLRCIILENKVRAVIKNFFNTKDQKVKIVFAIGLIGVVLIFFSEVSNDERDKQEIISNAECNYTLYCEELEKNLTEVISSIEGVGNCKVMITLDHLEESIYATNYESKKDEDSENYKDEYVIYDSNNGEEPVLITKYLPQVQGVTVVCSGGDDVLIKEKIVDAVTALFNISSNRVSVSKINEN